MTMQAPQAQIPRVFYGWHVVAACAVIACFAWGLGFYGVGIYIAALKAAHGWSVP